MRMSLRFGQGEKRAWGQVREGSLFWATSNPVFRKSPRSRAVLTVLFGEVRDVKAYVAGLEEGVESKLPVL